MDPVPSPTHRRRKPAPTKRGASTARATPIPDRGDQRGTIYDRLLGSLAKLPLEERLRLIREAITTVESDLSALQPAENLGLEPPELNGADSQLSFPEMGPLRSAGVGGSSLPPAQDTGPNRATAADLAWLARFRSATEGPADEAVVDLDSLLGSEHHPIHRLRLTDAVDFYRDLLRKYGYIKDHGGLTESRRRLIAEEFSRRLERQRADWADWVSRDPEPGSPQSPASGTSTS